MTTNRIINGLSIGLGKKGKSTQWRRITHVERTPAGGVYIYHRSSKRYGQSIPDTYFYIDIKRLKRLLEEAEAAEETSY